MAQNSKALQTILAKLIAGSYKSADSRKVLASITAAKKNAQAGYEMLMSAVSTPKRLQAATKTTAFDKAMEGVLSTAAQAEIASRLATKMFAANGATSDDIVEETFGDLDTANKTLPKDFPESELQTEAGDEGLIPEPDEDDDEDFGGDEDTIPEPDEDNMSKLVSGDEDSLDDDDNQDDGDMQALPVSTPACGPKSSTKAQVRKPVPTKAATAAKRTVTKSQPVGTTAASGNVAGIQWDFK